MALFGTQGGDRWALRRHVTNEFRKNALETDPTKVGPPFPLCMLAFKVITSVV